MKTNVIKLRFFKNGIIVGREYTYYSNDNVEVGEIVNIDKGNQGLITQINVPLIEIEHFKDSAKTIMGKVVNSESEVED